MSCSPCHGLALAFLSDMLQLCHRFLKSSQQGGPSCEHRAFHLPTFYPNTNVSTVRNLKSLGPQESKENLQQPSTGQRKHKTFNVTPGSWGGCPRERHQPLLGSITAPCPYLPHAITCTSSCQFWGPPPLSQFLKVTDVRRFAFFMHGLTR